MAHATWHTAQSGFHPNRGVRHGFKPPSEETATFIAIVAIVAAVVILHMRDAVKPRPEATSPGIGIEAISLTSVEVPVVAPRTAEPVVPPPPLPLPLEDLHALRVPMPQTSVRTVDLANMTALRNLATQTGASFDPTRTTYGQLSGAGDVALVPLQSGGSAGTLGVAVIGGDPDGTRVLTLVTPDAASRARLRVELEAGQLVVTTAVLGDEDPLCCPSTTKRSYYTWDGSKLRLEREITSANVSAKD